ncbi:MAG TPA: c-type cytochrome [Candidatus Hydrogenedentes bacterium]|nr:c-type cytochrome [Candidatus Hydrogenedentota bacterium]
MRNRLVIVIILACIAGMAFPVANLFIPLPASRLASIKTDNPLLADALDILEKKCVHCHTSEVQLPWYGKFPIAGRLIEHDILVGMKHADYIRDFFPEAPGPISEVALSKLEYVIEQGSMPPPPYLLMHWNHFLTTSDRDTLLRWVYSERITHHATPGNPPEVMRRGIQPLPESTNEDPAKVALGDKLFHDVRLSKDNTISCASCHDLAKGGTDQLQFSVGVGGAVGDINAPTVFNSGFQFMQFWDGRAADLEEQADGPVNNPIEMASNWDEVTEKLREDEAFTESFLEVYPDGYTMENFVDAIAAFERTLITPSPFDDFLKGDVSALDTQQQEGYRLFNDFGCATCHTGVVLGGKSFELMGLRADYFGARGNIIEADYGRFNVTENEYDRYRLKTPTLRNIALTFPYLHDGTAETLDKAVEVMMTYQVGKKITLEQTEALVAFLESLTGDLP